MRTGQFLSLLFYLTAFGTLLLSAFQHLLTLKANGGREPGRGRETTEAEQLHFSSSEKIAEA